MAKEEENYLFISCDGTKEIIPLLGGPHMGASETVMGDISPLMAGPRNIVIYVDDPNQNTFGCFRLDGPTKETPVEYNITGIFEDCQECKLNKFKTNQNILDRFESAKSEINDIVSSKKLGK